MKPLARKDLDIQEIESIHQSYLLDSLDWQGDKTIDLSEDTKVLLRAMLFDHGDGGFFLFRFDNKDFGGLRLQASRAGMRRSRLDVGFVIRTKCPK